MTDTEALAARVLAMVREAEGVGVGWCCEVQFAALTSLAAAGAGLADAVARMERANDAFRDGTDTDDTFFEWRDACDAAWVALAAWQDAARGAVGEAER